MQYKEALFGLVLAALVCGSAAKLDYKTKRLLPSVREILPKLEYLSEGGESEHLHDLNFLDNYLNATHLDNSIKFFKRHTPYYFDKSGCSRFRAFAVAVDKALEVSNEYFNIDDPDLKTTTRKNIVSKIVEVYKFKMTKYTNDLGYHDIQKKLSGLAMDSLTESLLCPREPTALKYDSELVGDAYIEYREFELLGSKIDASKDFVKTIKDIELRSAFMGRATNVVLAEALFTQLNQLMIGNKQKMAEARQRFVDLLDEKRINRDCTHLKQTLQFHKNLSADL